MTHRRYLPLLMVLLAPAAASGETLTLRWSANQEKDLAGYTLHYDVQSGPPYEGDFFAEGPSPLDIPLDSLGDPAHPEIKLSGAPPCWQINFAMAAYDGSNNSSALSEEISARTGFKPPRVVAETDGLDALVVAWDSPPVDQRTHISHYLVYVDQTDPAPQRRRAAGVLQRAPPHRATGAERRRQPLAPPDRARPLWTRLRRRRRRLRHRREQDVGGGRGDPADGHRRQRRLQRRRRARPTTRAVVADRPARAAGAATQEL